MSKSHKILIVDDEQHILQVLTLKLRNAGYEVLTAVDGEEGFDIACRERPDLVITDFQMPYMTGLELCRALTKQGETDHIPVLLLTARGYALDEQDLLVGNIREVLNKPFSPRSIVQKVDALLRGADGASQTASADLPLPAASNKKEAA
jgi:two-component system, OmpR family, alkaline phosphatase synthesis response regulator PhoP